MASGSGSTRRAASPQVSGERAPRVATTGVPQAMASIAVSPNPSCSDGRTKARACA